MRTDKKYKIDSLYQEIGMKLKAQRKALGMTRSDLALKLSVAPNQIMKIENGELKTFHVYQLVDIAEVLNVDLDYFIEI